MNKPPKLVHSTNCRSLAPIRIHCSILVISFPSASARFWITLAGETPSSTDFFPLHLIIHLNCALIGTTTGMSDELVSMSKYCSSIGYNERLIDYSTLTSCLVPFSMAPFSTCSFASKSPMIMTTCLKGEKCRFKPHNVFPDPSLTVLTRCNTFKISFFKSLS